MPHTFSRNMGWSTHTRCTPFFTVWKKRTAGSGEEGRGGGRQGGEQVRR